MARPVSAWLSTQGYTWKPEFRVPWGICDLVGARFDSSRVHERLELGQRRRIGPAARIDVWMSLPDHGARPYRRVASLARQSRLWDEDEIQSELDALVRTGFAGRDRDSYYRMNGWAPMYTDVVAIELKLHRISDAIAQAQAHKGLATASFVALPMDRAVRSAASHIAAKFKDAGVGLLGVSRNACELVLRPAESRTPDANNPLEMHAAERLWDPRRFRD